MNGSPNRETVPIRKYGSFRGNRGHHYEAKKDRILIAMAPEEGALVFRDLHMSQRRTKPRLELPWPRVLESCKLTDTSRSRTYPPQQLTRGKHTGRTSRCCRHGRVSKTTELGIHVELQGSTLRNVLGNYVAWARVGAVN